MIPGEFLRSEVTRGSSMSTEDQGTAWGTNRKSSYQLKAHNSATGEKLVSMYLPGSLSAL